ncbi:phosphohydrolase [Thermosipho melanesiensis]|uniref:Metal dependent phosphohydrolase n=2 Tax=Thermosipho melanesiensis TaxID=46541 RepID=A6LMM6_THEM4|nr:HD domain-containing phosphohydrolase [Thermosipho melanesiensis]ABR31177.1 metal dependent phosphohydrolase [Thermosipho melanesiensis BI429]APT74266.1 phosphohydrolase [Thermosipho melanesiensis]OOC36205.1 phosphohydrolase [Thermosipho melanesiensis]OOC37023.1 phosphohydrolase [Thermosipho melanesiensis]OOC37775.1 phosphohydrolase [Thermosipho melanesiensis]
MLNKKLLDYIEKYKDDLGFEKGEKSINIFKEGDFIKLEKDGKVIFDLVDEEKYYELLPFILEKVVKGHLNVLIKEKAEDLIVDLLVNIIVLSEIEDEEGFSHTQRVAKMAERFGKFIGMDEKELRKFVKHAYLHDVGKISLEQIMLYSPTRISLFEDNYQDHTVMGSIFLSMFDVLWEYIPTVRYHHERWDGKGFPDGLSGKQIPFYARVISILDYFDETTHFISSEWEAVLKTPKEALELIKKLSGRYFDPNLVEKFEEFLKSEGVV